MRDVPSPAHLLDDRQRVQAHVDVADAAAKGLLEAEDEPVVFGDVVRGMAQEFRQLRDDVAPIVDQDRAGTGRPGVPARRAVGVEHVAPLRVAHAAKSSAARARSPVPPETIDATRAPGRFPATATAMPAMSPPPPTPTTKTSASGRSSRTSKAQVPCPAIIAASSYGWRKYRPVRSTISATSARSRVTSGAKTTSAP